eukprot:CAMPEP_0172203246 /NCGR_PEP_ID=MMETSP1050-20130122/31160_1 /TAXON_ID=233186 /ORGANISM="Cryptomonas curvata, Strain CCAP979/52" /LENGTH=75 /DNA_ID=CAMNT_0012881405 /DNA_START=30 /DNA_END=253 /DNA_ORIENTATION=-
MTDNQEKRHVASVIEEEGLGGVGSLIPPSTPTQLPVLTCWTASFLVRKLPIRVGPGSQVAARVAASADPAAAVGP